MALGRVVAAGNRTTLNEEMCHEEIHRRSRADLADRDPVAHGDCKRSPRVAVEPGVRKQRLLTMFGCKRTFLPAARDLAFAWRSACTRESAALPTQNLSRRFYSTRCRLSRSSMARLDVRMSARAVKAKQGRLRVIERG